MYNTFSSSLYVTCEQKARTRGFAINTVDTSSVSHMTQCIQPQLSTQGPHVFTESCLAILLTDIPKFLRTDCKILIFKKTNDACGILSYYHHGH